MADGDNRFRVNMPDIPRSNRRAVQQFFNDNADALPKGRNPSMNVDITKDGKIELAVYSFDSNTEVMEEARKMLKQKYQLTFSELEINGRGRRYYSISTKVTEAQFYEFLKKINPKDGKRLADTIRPEMSKIIKEEVDANKDKEMSTAITPDLATKAAQLASAEFPTTVIATQEGAEIGNLSPNGPPGSSKGRTLG